MNKLTRKDVLEMVELSKQFVDTLQYNKDSASKELLDAIPSLYCKDTMDKLSGYVQDSNASAASGALPTMYTQIMPQVVQTRYSATPFANGEAIALTHDVDPWADLAYYLREDIFGRFGRIANNPTVLNSVEIGDEAVPYATAFYGAQTELSIMHSIRGRDNVTPGFNIEDRKIRGLSRSGMLTRNALFALGDGNIPGMLNHFDIPRISLPFRLDNAPFNGGTVSTDNQRLDALMQVWGIYTRSGAAYSANRVIASPSVQVDLQRPRLVSTNSSRSIWGEFSDSYPQFDKGITAVPECAGAGTGGTDVFVFYNDSPEVIKAEYTLPQLILPYEARALGVLAYSVFGIGGVHVLQPASCLIVEMPAADNPQ